MTGLRIGSLCTGIGGLDLAVPGELAWTCEFDNHAAKVLATHTTAPNFGDITGIDWATVEPVDLLTAGYPCQPFSMVGKRKGTDDSRHLWPQVERAVRSLRPRYVFLENVRGHLTLGFDIVLGSLADLGYVCRWEVLRASDVGAPHRRERVFILATDAGGAGRPEATDGARRREEPLRIGHPYADHLVDGDDAPGGRHRPCVREAPSNANSMARATRVLQRGGRETMAEPRAFEGTVRSGGSPQRIDWGVYGPAIRRWEALTRPAPAPVDDRQRLAPAFVEWMMGYPAGWVTDVDVARTHQLKMLGNAVIPQQADLAWERLWAPLCNPNHEGAA